MKEISLDEMLGDFTTEGPREKGKPVTLWLPTEAKAKWDTLQAKTRKKFGKRAQATLVALIDLAVAKVS